MSSLRATSLEVPRSPRAPRSPPLSSPPTVTAFQIPTHAGGILPSASFFRPSRPRHSPPPPSTTSSHPDPPRPQPSQDSHRRISDSLSLPRHHKRSQEPLLPLSNPPPKPDPPHNRLCRVRRVPSLDAAPDVIPLSQRVSHPLVRIPSSRPPSSSPSPNNVFLPDPPSTFPPLSAVPSAPRKRVFQLHPSRNHFFCAGRLLTSTDSPWAFIASLALVVAISVSWFATTCVWWWRNQSPAVAAVAAYMTLLTISCMLTTAFRDPGILPRNLDPDPPLPATSPSDGSPRVPLPRDLKIRADTVRVKYCLTCKTYRPPRSSHCRICDNCIDDCDHHCQWINNCIGRRNYTSFFCFLFSAVLTLCLVVCTSAVHLYVLTRQDHLNLREALDRAIGSAIAFTLSILLVWPVTALLAYHMRLLLLNITTIEQVAQLRNQAHKTLSSDAPPPNPFSYGSWRTNLSEVLCRPAGFSWLDAHAIVTEDKRRVNPALDDASIA